MSRLTGGTHPVGALCRVPHGVEPGEAAPPVAGTLDDEPGVAAQPTLVGLFPHLLSDALVHDTRMSRIRSTWGKGEVNGTVILDALGRLPAGGSVGDVGQCLALELRRVLTE